MNKHVLFLSPTQLAAVRGVPVQEIFKEIKNGTLSYHLTDEGIRIKITYKF